MNGDQAFIEKFGELANNSNIIESLKHLANIHALSPEDLFIKWEQFSYQHPDPNVELNTKNVDSFKDFLHEQIEKKAAQKVLKHSTNSSNKTKVPQLKTLGSSGTMFGMSLPNTPIAKKRKLLGKSNAGTPESEPAGNVKLQFNGGEISLGNMDNTPDANDVSFTPHKELPSSSIKQLDNTSVLLNSRIDKDEESGKILDSLNPENLDESAGLDLDSDEKICITPFYEPKKYKFKTMRQSLTDVADFLDNQIETFTKLAQEYFKLSKNEFGDPTIQSQSEIYAVGRVVPDSPTAEGFLNQDSLAIETSRMGGIGRRIPLNLTQVKDFSLFCGEIVVVRGKNANGEYFLVEEILTLPYPNSPVSTEEEIKNFNDQSNNKTTKTIITNGPYISNSTFDLTYLTDFVEKLNTEIKPHTVIMFGPFIDVTTSIIETGNIPIFPNLKSQPNTLDEIFTKVISPILQKINPNIKVILIPSTKDAISRHGAYPQDSLNRNSLQLGKNFKCFTNPCTFQLNEIFFGCSNVDIFKDMKEITKGGSVTVRNRFDRIMEHLLRQRRYYPVFPGSIKKRKREAMDSKGKKIEIVEHISGADLDVAYLGLTEFVGGFQPDIIVIPSELQYFARVIQNVITINPGSFVRGNGSRGTYAVLNILKGDVNDGKLTKMENGDDEENVYLHNVWKRTRVDIVKV